MSQPLLRLFATDSNWRLFMTRKADPAFRDFANRVLARDRHTCRYCGFQANSQMEIVNRDNNYHNNRLSNLATACPFCAQCSFIESVGLGGYGGGTLIYFPKFSQTQLNALCHTLFTSIALNTSFANDAKAIYRNLRLSAQTIEKNYAEGFSNPSHIGRLIIESDQKNKVKIQGFLDQFRLLPNLQKFSQSVEKWTQASLDQLSGGN